MTEQARPSDFGRVDEDGTVFVSTSAGERSVGQVPGVSADEAMAYFTRRFEALQVQVDLLEKRVRGGNVSPDEARRSVKSLKSEIATAHAVGDLDGLDARLDGLTPVLAEATEKRKAEKAEQSRATVEAKEAMVAEAEKLAQSNDWRGGVTRFRSLLDEWKALPRIDRATDDALWHRFSTARTTYTRRRKAQFAEQAEKRDGAKAAKQKIIEEARGLVGSTDWGATAGEFRDLMTRWKAAGPAPRDVDDKLWAEFRGLQDQFFAARTSAQAEQDAEFGGNQKAKEALLDEAERTVLPVEDLERSKAAFRDFLERYNAIGKVPRDAIRPLDQRVRALQSAVTDAEQAEWKRTDPEARHRAEETVAMFQTHIDKLHKQLADAEAKGDNRKIKDAQRSIETYQSWLDQAKATLADFQR